MGFYRMEASEKIKTDELEKGESLHVPARRVIKISRWRMERDDERRLYYSIMGFLASIFLLWQLCCLVCARPQRISRQVAGVPQYVLDYAPMIYLDTAEAYFPSDMSAQLANTYPAVNLTAIPSLPLLNLYNLELLNNYGQGGEDVYLTSNLDVTTSPAWLTGVVPSQSSYATPGAVSCAIIINDHGGGNVDAFYMYFYAYNQGNTVLWQELGDHIGDWEHNMIRFENGVPQAVWYSQHGNGQAFTYTTVQKFNSGIRPISYSARGSHANYAIPGTHDHTIPDLNLPSGLIQDYTSKGMLWDPTLSSYFYNFISTDDRSQPWEPINESPLGAMLFKGQWGDEQYPESDKRQKKPFFGFTKYVSGPTGPWDKQLNRTKVCPDNGILCIVRDVLSP